MNRLLDSPPSGRIPLWISAAWNWAGICALTLLAYGPALRAGFVWDDDAYVPKAAMRSWHGLWRIWFELGSTQQYYPAFFSAFWLEHHLWGDAALGYHLANILLHATSAWLLVVILRRLEIPGALLAGLIFALHPICVESVAWISEQKNTLSTVFYLLATLAYLRFDERWSALSLTRWFCQRRRQAPWGQGAPPRTSSVVRFYYVLATLLFVLALLSKTVTATLPAALLLILWWKRGRLSWKGDLLPLVPWLGLGATAGLFSAWVERKYIGAEGADFALNALQRCLLAGRAIWFYLGRLLWPGNLIFIYPRWRINAADGWQYLFPLAALALIAALWLIRRRTRAPLAVWLFFVGSLFPTLGFLNVFAFRYSYVADHWQYLASLGIIALAAAGITLALNRVLPEGGARCPQRAGPVSNVAQRVEDHAFHRRISRGLILILVGTLGSLTWRQCRVYHDLETFYRAILARNPAAWMAHNNLGIELQHSGRLAEAEAEFHAAIALRPNYAEAHNNLGNALLKIPGRSSEAIAQFEAALRLDPNYARAHYDLGSAWSNLPGRLNDAVAQLEEALRLQPDYAEAHYNLGNAWLKMPGRLNDAIGQFEETLRLQPGFAEAHNNLGNAWMKMPGRLNDAIAQYQQALRLKPDFAETHFNLAIALLRLPGRSQEAAEHLEAFLRLRPDNAAARRILARIRASPR